MKDLFFTPEIEIDFDWGKHQLRAGSVRPHNKKQISEGLRDMSPESIRNRFLGSKRDFSDQELQYLTHLDGWNHYAFGIEERGSLKRGVGIIRMVRSSHSESEAEIAITIIDEYQKKGLGSLLLDVIILAALERDIHTLSFTYLPSNDAITKFLMKAGHLEDGAHTHDYVQKFLKLDELNVDDVKSRLAKTLPVIGTFHSKT